MKQTVNLYQFREAFKAADRVDNFSCAGLGALFEYLEDYEALTGEELELDVISLCGDYTEYDSIAEYHNDYPEDKELPLEDLGYERTIIRIPGSDGFIAANF